MNNFTEIKEQVVCLNDEIKQILSKLKKISEINNSSVARWEETLSIIDKQITEDMLRVAVVGAIKSGKSTVANRLIGGDYLRRGAGVVTSVVTRIHNGQDLKAKICLKSWDEINRDINQAIIVFPSLSFRPDSGKFDIRNDSDRQRLNEAISSMDEKLHISSDARNEHSVFLTSYLKGYDDIIRITGGKSDYIEYDSDHFQDHGQFAGNEILASFVKDMELEMNTGKLDSGIELADCQGSDSPNPFHLAQVQDYLLKTNLVLYVISSRTGLRREDIRFLSMIKEMGVIDNIFFVVNFDFNEHGTLSDLKRVIEKIRDDVSLIKPSAEIYSFSGLFSLFQITPEIAETKDRQKYDMWLNETAFKDFNDSQFNAFFDSFTNKLSQKRYALLLKNNIEKMNIVAGSLAHWANLNLEIIKNDTLNVKLIHENGKTHQKKMNQIQKIIISTLEGEINKLKKGLKREIDAFFDEKYGDVIPGVIDFIHNYTVDFNIYKEHFKDVGFSNTLYMIFREFKQNLDSYMTETVNPKIIRFSKSVDATIEETLHSVSKPFESVIRDAVKDYQNAMDNAGLIFDVDLLQELPLPAIETVKKSSGLALPASGTITHYSSFIKTEAFLRYGFYSVFDYIRNVFRRSKTTSEKEGAHALVGGIMRIKLETEKSIRFYFLNYRENLKFKYIFALADALSIEVNGVLNERFNHFSGDLETISHRIEKRSLGKESVSDNFMEIVQKTKTIHQQITDIRHKIDVGLN
ncbi:MAG: dynamin family protein [Proteobacteria bacterium]|nr:dynamin family protein [Pseudomonadota bacterium]